MPSALHLDTSAVLRAVLEAGTTPEVEQQLREARALITSRLALVESARAVHRLRLAAQMSEARLADAEREIAAVRARCDIWELTAAVCDTARHVAPSTPLRTPDALHLATFVMARRRIVGLELLTADDRLQAAATSI